MDPALSAPAPAARASAPRLTVRGVLRDAWRIWFRNAGPLLGIALLLGTPVAAARAVAVVFPEQGTTIAARALLGLGNTFVSLATCAAIALAGARAARGEPLRVLALAREGLRRSWLTLLIAVFAAWAVVVVAIVAMFVMQPFGLLEGAVAHPRSAARWMLHAGVGLAYALAMVRFYPALAVVLAAPERGARAAMRRAKELVRGARTRVYLTALAVYAVAAPASAFHAWAAWRPHDGERAIAIAASALLAAALASFTDLAPIVVLRALEAEEAGAGADELGRVFD